MRTNFISPLYITNGGGRILAEGPLDWEGGTGHCRIEVEIRQNGVTARGDTGNYNQNKTWWECNADSDGGTFAAGEALATGTIDGGANPPVEAWPPQTVELVVLAARDVPDGIVKIPEEV
jgi:hypothetical protein